MAFYIFLLPIFKLFRLISLARDYMFHYDVSVGRLRVVISRGLGELRAVVVSGC